MLTRSQTRKIVLRLLFALAILALAVYALYQSRLFLQGPSLIISEPQNGLTLSEPSITIKGYADRIAHIYLNDRQIYTNEEGYFEEQLLLLPGYNIITVQVDDRFGRNVEKKLQFVLKEEAPSDEYLRSLRYEPPSLGTTTLPATTTR